VTRLARTLCTLYAATALWLAWCTVQTFGRVPLWLSILNTAASIVPLIAGTRESEHADTLRAARVQLERATRPPLNRQPITERERATFEQIAANYDKDQAA